MKVVTSFHCHHHQVHMHLHFLLFRFHKTLSCSLEQRLHQNSWRNGVHSWRWKSLSKPKNSVRPPSLTMSFSLQTRTLMRMGIRRSQVIDINECPSAHHFKCCLSVLTDVVVVIKFKSLMNVYIDLSGASHAEIRVSPPLFSCWDSDMASVLLLVYLLPPSGKKGAMKINIPEAVDHVVKFHKVSVSWFPFWNHPISTSGIYIPKTNECFDQLSFLLIQRNLTKWIFTRWDSTTTY